MLRRGLAVEVLALDAETGDLLVCEHCGGPRRVLTFLTDPPVIRRILEHLGLPPDPPAIASARAPPEPELPIAW